MATPILFSVIGEPAGELLNSLDEFQQIRNVQVKVEQMDWEDARVKLLSYSLTGKNPDFAGTIGVHPLLGVPFVSRDNLIVWQDTRHSFDHEQSTLDRVSFLVSETAQKRFCRSLEQFPVRRDAIEALTSPIENYNPMLQETFENGRSYKPIHLLSRYEQQLGFSFDNITNDINARGDLPVDS